MGPRPSSWPSEYHTLYVVRMMDAWRERERRAVLICPHFGTFRSDEFRDKHPDILNWPRDNIAQARVCPIWLQQERKTSTAYIHCSSIHKSERSSGCSRPDDKLSCGINLRRNIDCFVRVIRWVSIWIYIFIPHTKPSPESQAHKEQSMRRSARYSGYTESI